MCEMSKAKTCKIIAEGLDSMLIVYYQCFKLFSYLIMYKNVHVLRGIPADLRYVGDYTHTCDYFDVRTCGVFFL